MIAYFGLAILIGMKLDERYGTEKPYITAILILVFGFAFFYKLIKDLERDKKGSE